MRETIRSLTAVDRVFLAYIAFVTALVIVFWQGIPHFGVFLADHVLVAALICTFAWAHQRFGGMFWRTIHAWYPLLFIAMAFRELHYLVPRVNPVDADRDLMMIDRLIFGVDPTVWLQCILHPMAVELLQIVYTAYYFIPVVVCGAYYLRRSEREFDESMAAVLGAFFVSYAGYFLVPALGPRLTMEHSLPLQGVWSFEFLRYGLDSLELEMRDCFPSGHTMISVVALWYAWRFDRRMFAVLLPVVTALVFSTVYLRYHYVIDVLVGLLLTVGVCAGMPHLMQALRGAPALQATASARRACQP